MAIPAIPIVIRVILSYLGRQAVKTAIKKGAQNIAIGVGSGIAANYIYDGLKGSSDDENGNSSQNAGLSYSDRAKSAAMEYQQTLKSLRVFSDSLEDARESLFKFKQIDRQTAFGNETLDYGLGLKKVGIETSLAETIIRGIGDITLGDIDSSSIMVDAFRQLYVKGALTEPIREQFAQEGFDPLLTADKLQNRIHSDYLERKNSGSYDEKSLKFYFDSANSDIKDLEDLKAKIKSGKASFAEVLGLLRNSTASAKDSFYGVEGMFFGNMEQYTQESFGRIKEENDRGIDNLISYGKKLISSIFVWDDLRYNSENEQLTVKKAEAFYSEVKKMEDSRLAMAADATAVAKPIWSAAWNTIQDFFPFGRNESFEEYNKVLNNDFTKEQEKLKFYEDNKNMRPLFDRESSFYNSDLNPRVSKNVSINNVNYYVYNNADFERHGESLGNTIIGALEN